MKIKTTLLGILTSSLLLIAPAQAGTPAPTEIVGLNGLVNIQEFDMGYGVGYAIDVIEPATVSIDFFAVSNNSPDGLFYTEFSWFLPNGGDVLDSILWNDLYGSTYGLFGSLFGTDSHVSVFDGVDLGSAVTSDTGILFFLDHAIPSTEFIVAGGSRIIDRSLPGPRGVPDGGTTLLLLGTALCGLFLGAKKLRR